jgi:hypothetical protein
MTTINDLAIGVGPAAIPIGIGAHAGEQLFNIQAGGARKAAKGTARRFTKQGKKILETHKHFTDNSPLVKMMETAATLPEKIDAAMFSLLHNASYRANQQFLLGQMTAAEFKAGKMSPKREAEVMLKMGRWRQVEHLGSVKGSLSETRAIGQYFKWAMPPLMSTAQAGHDLTKMLRGKKNWNEGDWWAVSRFVMLAAAGRIMAGTLADEVPGAGGNVINKILRDSQGLFSILDRGTPRVRLLITLDKIAASFGDIAEVESAVEIPENGAYKKQEKNWMDFVDSTYRRSSK